MAVQENLTAGVAAVEVRTALCAGDFIDPSGLAGVAHLLQMPVKLFSGGLFPVENGVVAHLAVGDGLVNLPAAVYLAVQVALGLDTGFIVGVDEPDFRSPAHTAGNYVLPDDIGNVQKVDGL